MDSFALDTPHHDARAQPSPAFVTPASFDLRNLLNVTAAQLRDGSLSREAVLHAFANGLLFALIVVLVLVYYVMESFVRPIAWAIGVGFLLHPVKRFISHRLVMWLDETRARERILLVAAVEVPGRVSWAFAGWVRSQFARLLLMGFAGAAVVFLEPIWMRVATGLALFPRGVTLFFAGLDQWSSFTVASLLHVAAAVVVLAVFGVFLRAHKTAFEVVAHLLWAIAFTLMWPLLYSVLPRWLTLAGSFVAVVFVLLGLKPAASGGGAAAAAAAATTPARSTSRPAFAEGQERLRASSEIVTYLAMGCVSLLFVSYLPSILLGMLAACGINYAFRVAYEHAAFYLSGEVGALLFPRGVQVLWRRFTLGDAVFRSSVRAHVGEVSTVLVLLLFTVFVVAVPVYFTLCVYNETRDMARSLGDMWQAKSEFIPHYVNEKIAETREYIMTEGLAWMDQRLRNATGISFALLNTTATSLLGQSTTESGGVRAGGAGAGVAAMFRSLGDVRTVIENNITTFTSLLLHLRDNGRVLLGYAMYSLYAALSTTTSFLITFVIFFTTLFYVLAASEDEYKPRAWLRSIPFLSGRNGDAPIQVAVENVFHSTVMVSTFHGLFTWLSMTLLGARWVHLTTILSFTFSMLPFVGPYYVVLPAALDLYYRSASAAPALVLGVSHVLVYWFMDPLIWSEIKGTHPYFIALSVVGGLYLMGAEGIVMGPLLLIIVKELSSYIFDSVGSAGEASVAPPARTGSYAATTTELGTPTRTFPRYGE